MFRVDDNFALNITKPIPPDPASEYIKARINLIEPTVEILGEIVETAFFFESGQTRTLKFTYNTGYPAAHAINVFFFRTPLDAFNLYNPIIHNQPSVIVNPQIPETDVTGELEQEGTLIVTAPEATEGENTHYYGALVIYQNDLNEET